MTAIIEFPQVTEVKLERLARAAVDALREPHRRRGLRPFGDLTPGLREEWMKDGRRVVTAVLFELRLAFDEGL